MSEDHLRQLAHESYEYSSSPRLEESEWEQFVKFLLRKVERFVKSTALEVKVPEELTEGGRYSPRFVDEIASELDVIEDKKAGAISKWTFINMTAHDRKFSTEGKGKKKF